jgi:hypothetical protein
MTGSNRRPPACKAGALPAELILQFYSLATSYSHRGNAPTTIGAEELNFRVRNGNGCGLFAIITRLYDVTITSDLFNYTHFTENFKKNFIPSKLDNVRMQDCLCLATAPCLSKSNNLHPPKSIDFSG